MNFRTELKLEPIDRLWTRRDRFLALGSCFADTMAEKLERRLLPTGRNPLGVVFSPFGLARQLARAIDETTFEPSEFFQAGGLWRHFDLHSSFASPDRNRSVAQVNNALSGLRAAAANATVVLLTLGTAWSYRHRRTGFDVSHNHKLPSAEFEKRLLSVDEIVAALDPALRNLVRRRPELRIFVSVSPVRHLRDGIHENNLSKATLLLAARRLADACPFLHYIPAYELMLDDLRDYRFYADDLAHPNHLAIDYIWERVEQSYFDPEAIETGRRIESVWKALEHRPRHPDTEEHRAFRESLSQRIAELEATGVDVTELRTELDRQ